MITRLVIPVLITNIPVLIPVITDFDKYCNARFLVVYLCFLLFTIVYFYYSNFKPFIKLKKNQISLLLEKTFSEIESKIQERGNIPVRINIMKAKFNLSPFLEKRNFFKRCLLIEYHYKMQDSADLDNVIPVGVGVAGNALKEKKIKVGDFKNLFKNGYASWGYSPIDLQIMKGLKSRISVPIKDFSNENRIIGILNIDSVHSLEETPFQEEEFRNFLTAEMELLAPLIK